MKQEVDVLAVFDVGSSAPKPIRFKVRELGIKKTVPVTNINNIEWMRAGGNTRATVSGKPHVWFTTYNAEYCLRK